MYAVQRRQPRFKQRLHDDEDEDGDEDGMVLDDADDEDEEEEETLTWDPRDITVLDPSSRIMRQQQQQQQHVPLQRHCSVSV